METITKLRQRIRQDPSRFKAMSRLSHLLIDHSKTIKNSELKIQMKNEALELAQRCIEVSPHSPVGYGALSVSCPTFDGRMEALRKAIEIEESRNVSSVGLAYALLRLLVEPRNEEQLQQQQAKAEAQDMLKAKIPGGPSKNISKRELNDKEKHLYEKIKHALHNAETNINPDSNNESKSRSYQESKMIGLAHYRLGMFFRKLIPETMYRPSSLFHFKQCLKNLPNGDDNDIVAKKCRFWIATFGGDNIGSSEMNVDIDRCPEEYIVSLYSTFASKFDNLLVNKLKYETPSKLRKIVDKVQQEKDMRSHAKTRNLTKGIDLGCGTGLSGLSFQDCVHELYGIDLSPQMIERASSRKCYKNLFVGDVEDIFKILDVKSFDMIVACDVFVYIGDLRGIFESVLKHLCQDTGFFAFSTECLEECPSSTSSSSGTTTTTKPYVLHKNARFSHKRSYIEMLAKDVGFDIDLIEKSVIRKNGGKDVDGLLVVLSRSG